MEKRGQDVDDTLGYQYQLYDGSKLPRMSGCDDANALMTYIGHGGEKSAAIERYLDKNLSSVEQISEFLVGEDDRQPPQEATDTHAQG